MLSKNINFKSFNHTIIIFTANTSPSVPDSLQSLLTVGLASLLSVQPSLNALHWTLKTV